jgi:hypothetical protein
MTFWHLQNMMWHGIFQKFPHMIGCALHAGHTGRYHSVSTASSHSCEFGHRPNSATSGGPGMCDCWINLNGTVYHIFVTVLYFWNFGNFMCSGRWWLIFSDFSKILMNVPQPIAVIHILTNLFWPQVVPSLPLLDEECPYREYHY